MSRWPDFQTEDRRRALTMRFWLGVAGTVIGVLGLVLHLLAHTGVSLIAVLAIAVGLPSAIVARRRLRAGTPPTGAGPE